MPCIQKEEKEKHLMNRTKDYWEPMTLELNKADESSSM